MIVKSHRPLEPTAEAVTRAELREQLVELWAQVFERELRAERAAVDESRESTSASGRDGDLPLAGGSA